MLCYASQNVSDIMHMNMTEDSIKPQIRNIVE